MIYVLIGIGIMFAFLCEHRWQIIARLAAKMKIKQDVKHDEIDNEHVEVDIPEKHWLSSPQLNFFKHTEVDKSGWDEIVKNAMCPEAKSSFEILMSGLNVIFDENCNESYCISLFGGALRSIIRGDPPTDYDICIYNTKPIRVGAVTSTVPVNVLCDWLNRNSDSGKCTRARNGKYTPKHLNTTLIITGKFKPLGVKDNGIQYDIVLSNAPVFDIDFTMNSLIWDYGKPISEIRCMDPALDAMEMIDHVKKGKLIVHTIVDDYGKRVTNYKERNKILIQMLRLLVRLQKFLKRRKVTYVTQDDDGTTLKIELLDDTEIDKLTQKSNVKIKKVQNMFTLTNEGIYNVHIDPEKLTRFAKDDVCPICHDSSNTISVYIGREYPTDGSACGAHYLCPACAIDAIFNNISFTQMGVTNDVKDMMMPSCIVIYDFAGSS